MTDTTNPTPAETPKPAPKPAKKPADKKPDAAKKVVRKKAAPKQPLTIAGLARQLKIDPKVARRRVRANAGKAKPAKMPKPNASVTRKNARWEFADTAENRKALTAIITGKA